MTATHWRSCSLFDPGSLDLSLFNTPLLSRFVSYFLIRGIFFYFGCLFSLLLPIIIYLSLSSAILPIFTQLVEL